MDRVMRENGVDLIVGDSESSLVSFSACAGKILEALGVCIGLTASQHIQVPRYHLAISTMASRMDYFYWLRLEGKT